ncbi:MAG: class I SAM-dependent methyltransferase, partial [Gammaproteobacteria bacterium]
MMTVIKLRAANKTLFTPLQKNAWRILGIYLNRKIIFEESNISLDFIYQLDYENKSIGFLADKHAIDNNLVAKTINYENEKFNLLLFSESDLFFELKNNLIVLSDFISPVIRLLSISATGMSYIDDINEAACNLAPILNDTVKFLEKLLTISDKNLDTILNSYHGLVYNYSDINDFDSFKKRQITINKLFKIQNPSYIFSKRLLLELLINTEFMAYINDEALQINCLIDNASDLLETKTAVAQIKNITGQNIGCILSKQSEITHKLWASVLDAGYEFVINASTIRLDYTELLALPLCVPDPSGTERHLWINTATEIALTDLSNRLATEQFQVYLVNLDEQQIADMTQHSINVPLLTVNKKQNINSLIRMLNLRWIELFGIDTTWQIKAGNKTIEKHELDYYITRFSEDYTPVAYIDAAILSFRACMPNDVEFIIDVGSGTGELARSLPPYYKVMCVDLHEKMLEKVGRPAIVGNITDLPFVSKSVDLCISCDVIEHLSDGDLKKAVNELTRVSSKYIYLQVPYNENLALSEIICPKCNYKWHLNFHKQSFTFNKLK